MIYLIYLYFDINILIDIFKSSDIFNDIFLVLDISRHVEVYQAVVDLVGALAVAPVIVDNANSNILSALLSKSGCNLSLHSMLKQLQACISTYLNRLSSGKNLKLFFSSLLHYFYYIFLF